MVLHGGTETFEILVGGGEWTMSDLEGKMWGDGKNVSHCAALFFASELVTLSADQSLTLHAIPHAVSHALTRCVLVCYVEYERSEGFLCDFCFVCSSANDNS